MSAKELVEAAIAVLERRLEATGAVIAPDVSIASFVNAMRNGAAAGRVIEPNDCPLADARSLIPAETHTDTAGFVATAAESFGDLNWFRSERVPSDFANRSCAAELVGPDGAFAGTDMRVGLFQIAPDTDYPLHWHDAEENYVLVAGEAELRLDDEWFTATAGDVVHIDSGRPHALQTGAVGALILYTWSGDVTFDSYEVEPDS